MTKINTVANNGLTIVENYNKLLEQFRKAKTIDDVRILVASVRDFISVYKRVDKNMVNEIYGKLQSKLQDMVAENAFVYDRMNNRVEEIRNRAYDYANEKDDTQVVQNKALQLMSQMPKVMNSNHANRITKVLTDSINSGVIGSKAVLELLKYPKTKKSVRKVSIPDDVIPLLKKYHSEYIQTRFSHGTAWQGDFSNGGNLFIQADGKLMGHTTPYQYFTKHLHRYNEWVQNNPDKAKSEGLEELPIIPLHGLRHSCATLLNYLEINIIEISKTLGHSTCSTTMNIYAHSFEEQQEEVATKVNEFLRLNA